MTEHRAWRVGITGGIGSGKSLVCRLFGMLGVPVYDSDAKAKHLMQTDASLREAIKEIFGEESYREGVPDRAFLARKVFSGREALTVLNAAVHPVVIRDFDVWASGYDSGYVIVESAVLYESGLYCQTDSTVTVSAPEELRVRRAAQRDGSRPDQIRMRMRNQMSDSQRESLAAHVIYNDERRLLWEQVLALHTIFCRSAEGMRAGSGSPGK